VIEHDGRRIAELVDRAGRGDRCGPELLPTAYTLDGPDDHDPWWNFQLDGYGTWLWALASISPARRRPAATGRGGIHCGLSGHLRPATLLRLVGGERRPVHTSTLAAVAAGLRAALALVGEDGGPLLDPHRGRAGPRRGATIDDLIRGRGVHDGH
jgi:hypothetical protein